MCRQFDSGPRHRASFLANSQKRDPRKPASNTVKPLLYAAAKNEIGMGGRSPPPGPHQSSPRCVRPDMTRYDAPSPARLPPTAGVETGAQLTGRAFSHSRTKVATVKDGLVLAGGGTIGSAGRPTDEADGFGDLIGTPPNSDRHRAGQESAIVIHKITTTSPIGAPAGSS